MSNSEFFRELEKKKTDKLREIAGELGTLDMFDNSMTKEVAEEIDEMLGAFGEVTEEMDEMSKEFGEIAEEIVEMLGAFGGVDIEFEHEDDLEATFGDLEDDFGHWHNGEEFMGPIDEDISAIDELFHGTDGDNHTEVELRMVLINGEPALVSHNGTPDNILKLIAEFTRCVTVVHPTMREVCIKLFKELIEELGEDDYPH